MISVACSAPTASAAPAEPAVRVLFLGDNGPHHLSVRDTYGFETKVWPEAHKKGVALVGMKIYGGVLHGQKAPKGARLPNEHLHDAFRYAQGLPGVATVVVGMHDEIEMEQTIDWALNYKPLDEQEMSKLLARGRELAPAWGAAFGSVT